MLWVYCFGGCSFEEVFWIRVVFHLVIYSDISVFCMHLYISVAGQPCMVVNILNQNPCMPYAIKARGFPVCYIFKCCFSTLWVYVHLEGGFFEYSQLYFHDFFVPITCSKIFVLLSYPVVDMASPILHLISSRILFVCLEYLFWLYCLVLSQYLFSLPPFANIFWLFRIFF